MSQQPLTADNVHHFHSLLHTFFYMRIIHLLIFNGIFSTNIVGWNSLYYIVHSSWKSLVLYGFFFMIFVSFHVSNENEEKKIGNECSLKSALFDSMDWKFFEFSHLKCSAFKCKDQYKMHED